VRPTKVGTHPDSENPVEGRPLVADVVVVLTVIAVIAIAAVVLLGGQVNTVLSDISGQI
jgi:hypothetical protein